MVSAPGLVQLLPGAPSGPSLRLPPHPPLTLCGNGAAARRGQEARTARTAGSCGRAQSPGQRNSDVPPTPSPGPAGAAAGAASLPRDKGPDGPGGGPASRAPCCLLCSGEEAQAAPRCGRAPRHSRWLTGTRRCSPGTGLGTAPSAAAAGKGPVAPARAARAEGPPRLDTGTSGRT